MPYNVVCRLKKGTYRKTMLPQTELIRQLLLPTNDNYSPINFVKYIEDIRLYYEKDIRKSIKDP